MIAREQLPNDTFELKNIVCQLFNVVEEQKLLIANLNERVEVQLLKNQEQAQQLAAQAQQLGTQSQQIETQSQQLGAQSQQLATQAEKIEEQSQRLDQLTDQLSVLKRHQFGKRSKKNPKEEEKEQEKQDEKTNSQDGYFLSAFNGTSLNNLYS